MLRACAAAVLLLFFRCCHLFHAGRCPLASSTPACWAASMRLSPRPCIGFPVQQAVPSLPSPVAAFPQTAYSAWTASTQLCSDCCCVLPSSSVFLPSGNCYGETRMQYRPLIPFTDIMTLPELTWHLYDGSEICAGVSC